jgi:hypothetical protein
MSNTIEGCANAIAGKRSIKATKIIFFILI